MSGIAKAIAFSAVVLSMTALEISGQQMGLLWAVVGAWAVSIAFAKERA